MRVNDVKKIEVITKVENRNNQEVKEAGKERNATKYQENSQPNNSEKIENSEKLYAAVEAGNEVLKMVNRHIEFNIHEETGRTFVKVINQDTQEVIREIPPEEMLDMLARMWKYVGILVDERI